MILNHFFKACDESKNTVKKNSFKKSEGNHEKPPPSLVFQHFAPKYVGFLMCSSAVKLRYRYIAHKNLPLLKNTTIGFQNSVN